MTALKFCGMTRVSDVHEAIRLGADYIGVVFAPSPRQIPLGGAREIRRALGENGSRPKLVGVFGPASPEAIASATTAADLDVIQMHGDPTPADVQRVKELTGAEVWAVVRVADSIPPSLDALSSVADAIVLDRLSSKALGGTGETLHWSVVASELRAHRPRRLILAGGLSDANVQKAIRALSPDVVDVSSGVEASPGVKDPTLMRAFANAVRGA